jgi:HEAT repeat protein
MAASSLLALGPAPYREKILEQLKHARPGVRRNAAWLLGQMGDKSARPAIEAAYKAETDAEAKYAMEDALVALR